MRTLLPLLALAACTPSTDLPSGPGTIEPHDDTTIRDTPPTPPTPAPVCSEDLYEPNDAAAVSATPPLLDLRLSADDVDRFQVVLNPGEQLAIDALFSAVDGNLDLYLTTLDGDLLEWSTSDLDDEWIDYRNDGLTAETLWIETNLWEAAEHTCLSYDLSWTIEAAVIAPPTPQPPPPPVCTDDTSEPNQDWDSAPELLPVADGYRIFDFVSNDDDWFYLYATAEEQLEIIVHQDTPGVAIDLLVWDEVGEVADTPLLAGSPTTVLVNGGAEGQYVDLLVAPLDPNTCAPYTIEVISSLPTCADDLYEPNDIAPVFATPPLLDLSLFPGDVDRFAVTLLPGEELWVDAGFDATYGNVDLLLFDADGDVVDGSRGYSDSEALTLFNNSPFTETFTIKAWLYNPLPDTCQTYDLDWVIYGAVCLDDALEGDDTAFGSYEIVPELGTSVTYDLVADDDDWFWLEQLPGEELDLFLEHATPGADLEIIVYDSVGEVAYDFADAAWTQAHAPLFATALGGFYDVLIRPADVETCVPYTLTVQSY